MASVSLEMESARTKGDQLRALVEGLRGDLEAETDPELQRLVEVVLERAAANRASIASLEQAVTDLQAYMTTALSEPCSDDTSP